MSSATPYRGRFAPSPTGPLHFGSIVAAVGSYLDAKQHLGTWLVRIEDLDTPRCIPGMADDILNTLDHFGLHSDETVIYQSRRTPAYAEALDKLQNMGIAYPCCCARKEISDSALHGVEGLIYPGTCRNGLPPGRQGRSWRIMINSNTLIFNDLSLGEISQALITEIGDFIIKRADGLFAYQLAVVVDDAFQGITHVVRGADLLTSTARQIYLQQLLGFSTPSYLHLPVAINKAGEKLSKQTLAEPVNKLHAVEILMKVLKFLKQNPPPELAECTVETILAWGVKNWRAENLIGVRASHVPP
ncbi:MAG: tRNA glutamyl-Q(34) synthetase GluQRS [Gallionellaceae bacterium]|jgi:glutamyl-Q tRNA(Asp) synthetase